MKGSKNSLIYLETSAVQLVRSPCGPGTGATKSVSIQTFAYLLRVFILQKVFHGILIYKMQSVDSLLGKRSIARQKEET